MSLASRVVVALTFLLKRETHSALSHFRFLSPRRNLCLSPICPPWVWGEFTFWTTLSPLWRFHSREGGVLCEPTCPISSLLARGGTHNWHCPCCVKSREDLTSEPYLFPLVFSLKGGGRRYLQTIWPTLETSNPWGRFWTDLALA